MDKNDQKILNIGKIGKFDEERVFFFEQKTFSSFKIASLPNWEGAKYAGGSRPSCFVFLKWSIKNNSIHFPVYYVSLGRLWDCEVVADQVTTKSFSKYIKSQYFSAFSLVLGLSFCMMSVVTFIRCFTVARVVVDYFDSNLYWQILFSFLSVRPLLI